MVLSRQYEKYIEHKNIVCETLCILDKFRQRLAVIRQQQKTKMNSNDEDCEICLQIDFV